MKSGIATKILILDNEKSIVDVLSLYIQSIGYDPAGFQKAEDAIDFINAWYDSKKVLFAAILDLTIPGNDKPLSVLHTIKSLDSNIFTIAISAYSDRPEIIDPHTHGFDSSIAKPFMLSELKAMLDAKSF
jgi:DNA-binding NtrC family response regulator